MTEGWYEQTECGVTVKGNDRSQEHTQFVTAKLNVILFCGFYGMINTLR
jgi:hypothetical protein